MSTSSSTVWCLLCALSVLPDLRREELWTKDTVSQLRGTPSMRLIEDAKCNLGGKRGEIFAWAIYNAVRHSGESQFQNLRELLREHHLMSTPPPQGERSWVA